jgi:hypothetical protein
MTDGKKGKPKLVTETKFNMSSLVGDINLTKDIDLGNGYTIKTLWNILPACPKLHAALFKNLAEEEAAEDGNDLKKAESEVDNDYSTAHSDSVVKTIAEEN